MADSGQFWVSKDGENMGPFELAQIRKEIEKGSLSLSDHICEVGEDEWSSISDTLDLPDAEEDRVESRHIVRKGGSGGLLNAFLTVIFAVLVIVCVSLYFIAGFSNSKNNDAEGKVAVLDLVEIENNATEISNLEIRDGLTFMKSNASPFSGWSIQKFLGTGKASNLVQFSNGKTMNAHSWKPNGDKCTDTTLSDGSGSLSVYFDNGRKASESLYAQGLLDGMKVTWYDNGAKQQESFYQEGKLHGRSISKHRNGREIEETHYADGVKNGSYILWTEKGERIEEGSYLAGKRDGKRTIWTPDGVKDREENYLDGQLVTTQNIETDALPEANSTVPFDAGNASSELLNKAEEFKKIVENVSNRFSEKNVLGSESFATLASALFRYASPKGDPDQAYPGEADNFDALKRAFSAFRVNWGMNLGVEGKDFALSVIPESVSYGDMTLERDDFLASNPVALGANSLEDLQFILGETQKLFDSMELSIEKDSSYLKHEFAKRIWQDLLAKANGAKGANLSVKNGLLSFKDIETIQIKSIDSTGRSVFTDEKKEVDRVLSGSIIDKKMEKYLSVLNAANAAFVDIPHQSNPRIMIRTYKGLVIPVQGGEDLYPNVTIMLYGASPLKKSTVIRHVDIDLGQLLSAPVAD